MQKIRNDVRTLRRTCRKIVLNDPGAAARIRSCRIADQEMMRQQQLMLMQLNETEIKRQEKQQKLVVDGQKLANLNRQLANMKAASEER